MLFHFKSFFISDIKAYNMLGQLVLDKKVNSQTQAIDISHWNSGTYILVMQTEEGVRKQKIIKN